MSVNSLGDLGTAREEQYKQRYLEWMRATYAKFVESTVPTDREEMVGTRLEQASGGNKQEFHPEIAGVGIDLLYTWRISKRKFEREINDEKAKRLHDNNMLATMYSELVETVKRQFRLTLDIPEDRQCELVTWQTPWSWGANNIGKVELRASPFESPPQI